MLAKKENDTTLWANQNDKKANVSVCWADMSLTCWQHNILGLLVPTPTSDIDPGQSALPKLLGLKCLRKKE
jgi:hypothetical protein